MGELLLLETGDALLQEDGFNIFLDEAFAQSLSVALNQGTITRATLTATYTGTDPTLFMTADGINFEEITSGVAHTFANSGVDLRWRAEGRGVTITNIKIEYD